MFWITYNTKEKIYLTENRPRFGFCLPANIFKAVDFPIPLVPTRPNTSPGLGIGSLCNLNEFFEYLCVVSFSKLLGRLIIDIASKGHFWNKFSKNL